MKKSPLINQPLSNVIAGLGHLDTLVIADAGLPIPPSTQRIDLAVTRGIPSFLDVLQAVLTELKVQSVIIADELKENSPLMYRQLLDIFGEGVPIESVPHEQFKQYTRTARAVVRTGEFTPYANVILVAGVVF
jgi:D-ribose pyranase